VQFRGLLHETLDIGWRIVIPVLMQLLRDATRWIAGSGAPLETSRAGHPDQQRQRSGQIARILPQHVGSSSCLRFTRQARGRRKDAGFLGSKAELVDELSEGMAKPPAAETRRSAAYRRDRNAAQGQPRSVGIECERSCLGEGQGRIDVPWI